MVRAMSLMRSRWAAIGASVAVTLGAGGLISVNAANDTSSLVPVTPARILDTRSGDRVGSLDTAGASDPYRLKVVGTGGIPTSGVTAVSLNVTAVDTQTNDYGGFVSVYPCASVSTAKPDVSNMNFGSGQTIANAVTVPVSTDGHICLYVYGTAHLLVDANGYYTQASSGTVDAYTKSETDTQLATKADVSALLALATGMQTPTTVDSTGNVGGFTSIATGDNGNPIISYYDDTNGDLKVAACTTPGCTGTATITTVDSTGNVGWYTSIATGDNGNPIISYYDDTNGDLKVAACTTTDCTGTATITTVDSTGRVGWYTSIAIGDNGLPVISYYNITNPALKVAACTTTNCTGTATITTIDSTGIVGGYTSIAMRDNGNPIISYFDNTNPALKVAACTTTNCTGTTTITTIDSTGLVGINTSIAIRDNGLPVISYYDITRSALKVAACTTTNCTGTATITTIDSTVGVGEYTSIAIRDNGLPVISYYDFTNDDLKVAACTTTNCTGTTTITTIDSTGDVGEHTSIAIRDNGLPVISYNDFTNSALKVAACTTTNCTGAATITTIDSTGNVGLNTSIAIRDNGLPVISYYDATNGDLKVVPMWSLLIGN